MAELIRKEDTLNQGREKLNEAIKDAETAKNISAQADDKATQALTQSESTQTQLDTIVINGDSSVEAAQARVSVEGTVYGTLKQRLDTEYEEVTSQLAQSVSLISQPDYVDFIRSHSKSNGKLKVKRTSTRNFELGIPLSNGKYQRHTFVKDNNDDFIKHSEIGIANFGESSFLKERKNYDSTSGTGWVTSSTSHYTTVIGSSFSFTFNGTGLDFYSILDSRGGIWEFVIDGGTPIHLSTHSNTASEGELANEFSTTLYKKVVTRNLSKGNHTLVATFKGEDPNNPPSSTPARGWVYYNTGSQDDYTFDVYDTVLNLSEEIALSPPNSNKEFAIGMKKSGATYGAPFVPDHGQGSAFPIEQFLYYDNASKSLTGTDTNYVEVDSVRLIQKVRAVNPNEPTLDLAYIYVIHTANSDGLHCKVKIEFLVDTWLSGYVCMLPCTLDFARELLVSTNDKYEAIKTDDTLTDIPNGDKAKSFAFINTNGTQNQKNTIYAMTVDNVSRTFRHGKEGRRTPNTLWLQHRSTMQKLYPQIVDGYTAKAGETLEAGYTMFAGQVEYASMLIK